MDGMEWNGMGKRERDGGGGDKKSQALDYMIQKQRKKAKKSELLQEHTRKPHFLKPFSSSPISQPTEKKKNPNKPQSHILPLFVPSFLTKPGGSDQREGMFSLSQKKKKSCMNMLYVLCFMFYVLCTYIAVRKRRRRKEGEKKMGIWVYPPPPLVNYLGWVGLCLSRQTFIGIVIDSLRTPPSFFSRSSSDQQINKQARNQIFGK